MVKERAPGLALRVIRLAARFLPRTHRDRYHEEWAAELDEMKRQNVSQLVSSLRILLGAPSAGWALRVWVRRQLLLEGGRADAITQLVRNSTQIYRDCLLGLTMQSRHTIDAISLSTAHDFDGGLWISDLGQHYLALQRDAACREVVIRRVFIIDQHGQADQDLLRICRQQKDVGIRVRVLDQSAIPDVIKSLVFDFVVFDGVVSYEVPPVSYDMRSTAAITRLVLQSGQVEERMRQFEDLWSAALEIC